MNGIRFGRSAWWVTPATAFAMVLSASAPVAAQCPSGAGGCCLTVHANPGCNAPDCCNAVCAMLPACCAVTWDAACVALANTVCDDEMPGGCNANAVGAGITPLINGVVIPPGASVVPGQVIHYRVTLAGQADSMNFVHCDIVNGQVGVTLPNWQSLPAGQPIPAGKFVEVGGWPGTLPIGQFSNDTPFVRFTSDLPGFGGYVADPADCRNGFFNARVDYGDTFFLSTHLLEQEFGTFLSDPLECTASATASIATRCIVPDINLVKTASTSAICEGSSTPVTYTFAVSNKGGAPIIPGSPAGSLQLVSLDDDLAGCVINIANPMGDNGDGLLNPGETWTFTCTVNLSQTTVNTAVVTAKAIDYNGQVVDSVTYTAMDSETVTASPGLMVSVNPPSATKCAAALPQQFCAVVAGGTPGYTFNWDGPGGFDAATMCINATTPGQYCVTVTDSLGCTGMACATLTVNPQPTVDLPNVTTCPGQPAQMCATGMGGTPPYAITVSGPGGMQTCMMVPANGMCCLPTAVPGLYTATLTDAAGCTASDTGTLSTSNQIQCQITGPDFACEEALVNLCVSPTGGTAPYNVTISGPGGVQNCPVLPAGGSCCLATNVAGLYTATVTDAAGCTCSSTRNLTVSGGPNLELVTKDKCVNPLLIQQFPVQLHLTRVDQAGTPIVSYQAFVSYDPDEVIFLNGNYVAPFSQQVSPIQDSNPPGTITLAASVPPGNPGVTMDTQLAVLNFVAKLTLCDDTNFDFDTSDQQNLVIAQPPGGLPFSIKPCLIKSPVVIIDGEAPRIKACCNDAALKVDADCQAEVPDFCDPADPNFCDRLVVEDDCTPADQILKTQFPAPGTPLKAGETVVVTITVTDCANNTAFCQVDVTAEDNTPPTINQCPPNRTLKADNDCLARVPDLTDEVEAKDNCDNPALLTITQDPPADTDIGLGSTVVTITVTDDFGNEATCQVKLTVVDNAPPKLVNCPLELTLKADPITCKATLGDLTQNLIAVDNCTFPPQLVFAQNPPAGTVLQLGSTSVLITVTDLAGHSDTCTIKVNVIDNTPPQIECPATLKLTVDANCQAVLPEIPVLIFDSCGMVSVTQDPPAGKTIIGVGGEVSVVLTATDESGNTTTCKTVVTTNDETPPTIVCPAGITIPADANCKALVPQLAPLMVDDNCTPPQDLIISQDPPFGTMIMLGRTTVQLIVTDPASGLSAACKVNINVIDTMPPVITCPDNITAECEGPDGAFVPFTVTAVDACDPNPQINCFVLDDQGDIAGIVTPGGDDFPIGRTFVICQAKDGANNFAFCLFSINVVDTTPPSGTCELKEDKFSANPSCHFVLPDFTGTVTVDDLCDDSPSVIQVPPQGTVIGLGSFIVTFVITDDAGNSTECKAKIEVNDTTPPSVSCPGNLKIKANDRCVGQVPNFLPGVVANDNCTPSGQIVKVQNPPPFSLLPPGTGSFVITITATDAAGNVGSCTVVLEVNDQTDPVIYECGDNAKVSANASCLGIVPDMTNGVVADDNCTEMDNLIITQSPLAGATRPLGVHPVVITVTDEDGNSSTCTLQLTVNDTTPPVVACPDLNKFKAPPDTCQVNVPIPFPAVFDNCDTNPLVIGTRSDGLPLNAPYPLGQTIITWTAIDDAGNSSSCIVVIQVNDNVPPVITCPSNVKVNADVGLCTAEVDPGEATARDSCDNNVKVHGVRADGLDLDDPYPAGSTKITWTATDNEGNVSTCQQFVTVNPFNELKVDIDYLKSLPGTRTRCIRFELFTCNPLFSTVVQQVISFQNGEANNVIIQVPCGYTWTCITAKDTLHTLRRRDNSIVISNNRFVADFTGANALISGDLNNDGHVDAIDFAIYQGQQGQSLPQNTNCTTPAPHSDLNGDGIVNFQDGQQIQANFLEKSDPNCCGQPAMAPPGGPAARMSVGDLGLLGLNGASADLNGDGFVDIVDITLLLGGSNGKENEFAGGDGSSWFEDAGWSDGAVPGSATDVAIPVTVMVDRDGAVARNIRVAPGGNLTVMGGSLVAAHVVVQQGGALTLTDEQAILAVESLTLEPGSSLKWVGGTIEIDGGVLISDLPITLGLEGAALLSLQNGADVWTPHVSVGPLGELWGSGTIHGHLINAGLVEPVDLFVEGDYTQLPGADLIVTPAAPALEPANAPLQVGGIAVIGGTLTALGADGILPAEGQSLGILEASLVEGAFDTTVLAAPGLEVLVTGDRVVVTTRQITLQPGG
jgi:hypothetical protein